MVIFPLVNFYFLKALKMSYNHSKEYLKRTQKGHDFIFLFDII